jgi:hypothetical protein
VPAAAAMLRYPSEQMLVFLGLSIAGTLIPQIFATVFSSWAFAAAQDARVEHDNLVRVETEERIADAIQADYLKRYADIMTGVVPLLRALATGEPPSTDARRQARAESRRLRTLFDQLRTDHPLIFEIRAVIEEAEDRGVDVAMHCDGDFPRLEQGEVDRIVGVVEGLIALATVSARVVVSPGEDGITISVVCEVAAEDVGRKFGLDDVELVWSDQTAWMTLHHQVRTTDEPATDCTNSGPDQPTDVAAADQLPSATQKNAEPERSTQDSQRLWRR